MLISAGTWVTRLLPDLPIQPVRKVFAWFQADGRYSSKNHFPAFTGELPNGDQYYGFPAEDNELKIGKHNGGQPVSRRRSDRRLALSPAMVPNPFRFYVTSCPGSAAVCTAPPAPMTTRSMKILLSIRSLADQTHC
ncbi:N-methyl-L-tryptophan oxidase [Klebsiella variicola]|nr:N-methyl-L-tryptophan oxidase [Klebsiella variicola]